MFVASSMNHVPVTTFYSLDVPWVVICRDRPRTCRTKPGYPSRLSPDLATYWESVSFRSRPAWLKAKATDGAMTG